MPVTRLGLSPGLHPVLPLPAPTSKAWVSSPRSAREPSRSGHVLCPEGWHPECTGRCEAWQTQPGLGDSEAGSSSRPRGARHMLRPRGGDRWDARCAGREEEQSPCPFRPAAGPGSARGHAVMLRGPPGTPFHRCRAHPFFRLSLPSALRLLPAWLPSSSVCWLCRAGLGEQSLGRDSWRAGRAFWAEGTAWAAPDGLATPHGRAQVWEHGAGPRGAWWAERKRPCVLSHGAEFDLDGALGCKEGLSRGG